MEEFDHELLISVTSGLGSWQQDEAGNQFYAKDPDCLGKPFLSCVDGCLKLLSLPGACLSSQHLRPALLKSRDGVVADCLKDLQRFLRQDQPATRPAFAALSRYNVARADLVPLIVAYPADVDLVFNACTMYCLCAALVVELRKSGSYRLCALPDCQLSCHSKSSHFSHHAGGARQRKQALPGKQKPLNHSARSLVKQ